MKKSPLIIQPVRKYKNPRYPGWQEPNPLDHPDAAPYPFSKKVLRFLTAIGMTSAAISSCSDEHQHHSNDPNWIPPDSLRNTFTFETNGLPYQFPAFGSGSPENLQRRFAIAVLENLARNEGFEMQKDYVFQSDGVKIQLDGWDAKRRTGFVFVHYGNSEDGINDCCSPQPDLIDIIEQDSSGNSIKRKYFRSWSAVWDYYDGHPQQSHAIDSLTLATTNKNIPALILQFPDVDQRTLRKLAFLMARFPLEFYDSEWDEKKAVSHHLYFYQELTKHLQQLVSSPTSSPYQRIALFEDFDKAEFLITRLKRSKKMEAFWISLFSIPDQAERQRMIKGLIFLYRNPNSDDKLQKRFDKALSHPKIDLLASFSKELEDFDQKTISLAEMRQLDQLAASGKAYVMPVSFMDSRLRYYSYWTKPKEWGDYYSDADAPAPPDFLDSLRDYQQKKAALPDSIRHQPQKLHEKNERDALSELERQARYYLRWAKSQGL